MAKALRPGQAGYAKKSVERVRKELKKNPEPAAPVVGDDVDIFGRPTKYRPEMDEQIFKLALLACTQQEMARYFEVAPTTLDRWLASFPSFRCSMRAGGDDADMEVVSTLHKLANGFTVETQEAKVVNVDRNTQKVEIVNVQRYIPPDYRAMGRWLGNRRRHTWSEKVEVNITDPAEAARAAQAAIAAADKVKDE